jgi:Enoyl-(Acyl carrier protein) reductase
LSGLFDPDLRRNRSLFWSLAHEALRVKLIGDIEHLLTLLQDGAGLLVVHHGRREQCQARVVMFFVVPTKKSLRESATVLNAAEAVGKLGTIFHGAELTLRVGVVIGNVRTAMGLGHSQVGQEESNRLGAHRGATIGMQGELTGIRVNVVSPGNVAAGSALKVFEEDPAYREFVLRVSLGRRNSPESIADAFVFLCSPLASEINGQVLSPDYGGGIGNRL